MGRSLERNRLRQIIEELPAIFHQYRIKTSKQQRNFCSFESIIISGNTHILTEVHLNTTSFSQGLSAGK